MPENATILPSCMLLIIFWEKCTFLINCVFFSEHCRQFFLLFLFLFLAFYVAKRGRVQSHFFVSKLYFTHWKILAVFKSYFLAWVFTNVMKMCLYRCLFFILHIYHLVCPFNLHVCCVLLSCLQLLATL